MSESDCPSRAGSSGTPALWLLRAAGSIGALAIGCGLAHAASAMGPREGGMPREDLLARIESRRLAREQAAKAGSNPVDQGLMNELDRQIFESLLAQLDGEDWFGRARATEQLRSSPSVTLRMLEQALAERRLSLEQRERLMDVARTKFLVSPRGAMGIRFMMAITGRVVIEQTYAGFASYDLLEPGDVIVSVNGIRLEGPTSRRTMQAQIISRDPGDVMDLEVRRGKEKLRVAVTLGSFSELTNANMLMSTLMRAWDTRTRTFAPETDAVRIPRAQAWLKPRSAPSPAAGAGFGGGFGPANAPGNGPNVGAVRASGGGIGRQIDDGLLEFPRGQQVVFFRNNQVIMADPRRGFAQVAGNPDPFEEPLPAPESLDDMITTLNVLDGEVQRALQVAPPGGAGAQPGRGDVNRPGDGQGQPKPGAADELARIQRLVQVGDGGLENRRDYLERLSKAVPRVREALEAERAESPPTPPQAQAEGG